MHSNSFQISLTEALVLLYYLTDLIADKESLFTLSTQNSLAQYSKLLQSKVIICGVHL